MWCHTITNVHVSHNTNVCQQLSPVVPVVPLPIPVSSVVQSLGRFREIWVKITNFIDPELPTHSDKYTKKMSPRVWKFQMESVILDGFQPEYVGECNILLPRQTAHPSTAIAVPTAPVGSHTMPLMAHPSTAIDTSTVPVSPPSGTALPPKANPGPVVKNRCAPTIGGLQREVEDMKCMVKKHRQ